MVLLLINKVILTIALQLDTKWGVRAKGTVMSDDNEDNSKTKAKNIEKLLARLGVSL